MLEHKGLFKLTRVVSYLACGLSLAFSIWYWGTITNGMLKIIYIGCGLVFDVTKIVAISFAIYFVAKSKFVKSVICAGIFLLLSLVSVYGSITVLNDANVAAVETNLAQSLLHKEMIDAISAKKNFIAKLEEIAYKDYDSGYKSRANATLKQIATENDKLQKLQSDLANEDKIKLVNKTNQGNFLTKLMIIILGSLLEIVTSFLLFLTSTQEASSGEEARNLLLEEASSGEEPLRNPGTLCRGTQAANDNFYQVVEEGRNVVNFYPLPRGTHEALDRQGVEKKEEPRNLELEEASPSEEARSLLLEEASSAGEPLRNLVANLEEPLIDLVNKLKATEQNPSIKNLKNILGCAYSKAKNIQQQLVDSGYIILEKNRPVWIGQG